MDYLNTRESVLNCPICRGNANLRGQRIFPKQQYIKEFSRGMYQFWQHKYKPVSTEQIRENFKKTKKIPPQKQRMPMQKDGYEQIYRKLMMKEEQQKKSNHKITKRHTNNDKPRIIYQIYTLTTDNDKLRKNSSRILYSYPYSSSSNTSTSLISRERKRSVTMHPSTKKDTNDDDTDSEFDSCHKFPITEKHYRHIRDGIECSSQYQQRPSSYSKTKQPRKEERKQSKTIIKRADVDFNQINFKQLNPYGCVLKAKKKCTCKHKCQKKKTSLLLEDEDRSSCSQLSEKTFAKFINSLHSYVSKTKRYKQSSIRKKQTRRLDTDSSCSLCMHEKKYIKKKKSSSRDHHHHDTKKHCSHHQHHRHHKTSHHTSDNEDVSYLHK